jgi:hypothetical protein
MEYRKILVFVQGLKDVKNYILILIISSLSILYFIPNIYSENGNYPNKYGAFVTFSDFQYENTHLDYNKILKVSLNKANFENNLSNKTEIQNDVNDIISKLSPLIIEKNRILLHDFLIDLSEDIQKGGNNDTSYMKWIKKQIDTEEIKGPISNALVFLAGELSGEQPFYHERIKIGLAHLINANNYSLPESMDERDAKSIDFLLRISPPIIRSIDSNDIVFSGKDANMMAQRIGFNEKQSDEIEGIIYLVILEGHNKGANITKLAMNILSKWEEDRQQTFIENRGESQIELWLRTFSVIEPSVRNAIIDLGTNMTLNDNEDKIYVNLIDAGRQIGMS